jgi:hypothetical protein
VAFAVGAIFFPTLLLLIATAIRRYKKAPVTSAADFVGLTVLLDGLLMVDPSQVLTHVKVDLGTEGAVSVTLIFLTLSFAVWYFCLFEVEPRIAECYINGRPFPLKHLLTAWATSLSVVALQIAFFTGRVASWLSPFKDYLT